jgi:hypothetical protein
MDDDEWSCAKETKSQMIHCIIDINRKYRLSIQDVTAMIHVNR